MAITNASRLANFGSGIGTEGAVLQVDNTNERIGIGTTNPNATLTVGNIGVSGTSIYVYGDGRIVGVLTATKFSGGWDGALSITDSTASTSTSTGALIVSGGVGIAKSLFVGEGVSVAGTITYDDVTNIDSVGIVTAGKGFRATTGGLIVTAGVSTFTDNITVGTYGATAGPDLRLKGSTSSVQSIYYGSSAADYYQGYLQYDIVKNRLTIGTNKTDQINIDSSGNLKAVGIVTASNVRVPDNGKFTAGAGNDLEIYHNGTSSYIDNSTNDLWIRANSTIYFYNKWDSEYYAKFWPNAGIDLYHNNAKKFETTSAGITVTGTVTDSKGDVRKIPGNTQASTYTLVAADSGKYVWASGTVTVPQSVFSAGDVVTIVNDTNSDLAITKSIATMYMSSDGTSANRTLSAFGMATILFVSGTAAYISGAGLS